MANPIITDATIRGCTCHYDWGGYCKHIVAVLLTFIRDRAEIADRPPGKDLHLDQWADRDLPARRAGG